MEAIRDDTVTSIEPHCFDSAEHFLEAACAQASRLRLDRTEGRKSRLAVFCEATGLVPQLARVAEPYGIRVVASGGFDSLTFKHGFAVEVSESDRPFEVLHIGDHDPSGGHMFVTLSEDITAFVRELRGKVVFTRVAVTNMTLAGAPESSTERTAKRSGERSDRCSSRWRAYASVDHAAAAKGWDGICEDLISALRGWPIREIEGGVGLSEPQRITFYELVISSLRAADMLVGACPAETALTPVGRMETLRVRLSAAQAATATIRPAFAHFFDSLDQAQQVRFAPMN